jgi:hypothetical protein
MQCRKCGSCYILYKVAVCVVVTQILSASVIITQYYFEGFILGKLDHHYLVILSRTLVDRIFVGLLFVSVETKLIP